MMSSEQCRSYAAECRELFQTAASSQQKTILLDLARHWEMAAKEMKELEHQNAEPQKGRT